MRTIRIQATPEQLKQINAFIKKIGAEVVKSEPSKVYSKKEVHPYLLETDNYCKHLKNEIIKEYNKTTKVKAKPVL
ncbi:MAG: hypothetical protein M9897_10040 [Brumimicrobium sp.]|nr:hypothetical protein [Brumimicrobium sp.]